MNDDAVADVVGTILLVGITVAMMAGLSLLVLNIAPPDDQVIADLAIDIGSGPGGWGDGDETLLVRHLGGERVDGVEVILFIDGVRTDITPTDQGFTDGELRIGEQWIGTVSIDEGARVEVALLHKEGNAIVASTSHIAGGSTGPIVPPPGNQAPSASFTFTCTDLSCNFDGSGSSDADGTVQSWAWDFAGTPGSGQTTSHTFPGAGTYTVVLTVTDDDLATAQQSRSVAVAPGNQSPSASFTFTCTDLLCNFDGSGSSDADGTVQSWGWDFAGTPGSGQTTSHTFPGAGTYTVVLTVTDDDLATGEQSQDVTVTAPGPPADPGFAYEDVGCDGRYHAGTDSNVAIDVADGSHDAGNNCLVVPSSATPLVADSIDLRGEGVTLRGAFTSTNGDIDIRAGDGTVDASGAVFAAQKDLDIRGNGPFLLAGITAATAEDDILIGWSGGGDDRPSSVDLAGATLTGDDDVRVRSDGAMDLEGATMRSLSNGNNLHARSVGAASMNVDLMVIDDQDDELEVTPDDAPTGTPSQGSTA